MDHLLDRDADLKARFTITGREVTPEDGAERYVLVACKSCTKAWEILVDEVGAIGKGERLALLQHAKGAHESRKRMRQVS